MFRRFRVACATRRADKLVHFLLRECSHRESAAVDAVYHYDLPCEKANQENPQIFLICRYKNIFPMNLPRATRRAFEIVKHRKKLQPMEELKLYEGRPADCTGRLEKEIRTYDLLDKLGIQFWRTDHGWMKADTMEDCHVIDACLNATVCKNLFLCNRQKTNFYLLMMPGDKPFKTKELSHQLGIARLSFASPEDMEQYLDCTPGSSSIMGLANDTENKVQLLMDEDVKKGEYLGCHPCINTSSLKLRTADVLETFLPAVHHEPIFVQLTGE